MKIPIMLYLTAVMMLAPSAWEASRSIILATEVIGRFGVDRFGAPLFSPDAGKNPASLGL